jgi:FMN phosphatase YigB (HAD superfamily)
VSDFDMPTPPATPAKIKPIFARYVAILDQVHLRQFFDPVGKCVTLSTHAGVFKPDRKVFELALRRLRVTARLPDCIFITENGGHVTHCRQELGMKALQFGKDFTDWSQAPLLVASLAASGA